MKVIVCTAIGIASLMMGGGMALFVSSVWAIVCLLISLMSFCIACNEQERRERRNRSSKYYGKRISNWEVR